MRWSDTGRTTVFFPGPRRPRPRPRPSPARRVEHVPPYAAVAPLWEGSPLLPGLR
ncbi:hypothetical protein [Streptomyces sp. NPDC059949]|uniref:hypothetical protein n=1 Tax=Streptomyces sp. NPDC059949 TaxID=3347013 RepID=UPI00364D9E57